ncbi:hypothetical protein ACFOGJ_03825 [Marinibaculum pumilum]|uniref:Cardiolipin synthase N-terminal domain-containing protein n=1 Tax=Marinibaculum pumilum TaxID=1766165 RepID=A0ABV7KVD8_9PROT
MGIIESLIVLALVLIPLWRVFERTGRSGAWSLLAAIPGIGGPIAALLWGYGTWPKYEAPAGPGSDMGSGGSDVAPHAPPPPPAGPSAQ